MLSVERTRVAVSTYPDGHAATKAKSRRHNTAICIALAGLASWYGTGRAAAQEPADKPLVIVVNPNDGSYSIGASGLDTPILHASIAARIDGHWLRSSAYPRQTIHQSQGTGLQGSFNEWNVAFSGLPGEPDLSYRLRRGATRASGEIQATVQNTTDKPIKVQSIRVLESTDNSILNLGGPPDQDRILSDSFSEDVPAIRILNLKDADKHMHRAVGSQLIYNRQSQWSFFAGALTTNKFLTLLRLHLDEDKAEPRVSAFEVDSTGTTEITQENSLLESPAEDKIALSLPMLPGSDLSSETLYFSAGKSYHQQLEAYGDRIRRLHHARTKAPPAMGWWSWTAYYYGLTEGAALTNAQWLSEHLSALGYTFFHLDEGYQYARGEYTTPDATLYPHGVAALEDQVRALGLTPGIWTAPFEVSERSSIYLDHKDWLVHNALGQPIHLGWANNHLDRLYVLDVTHPAAQQYVREMYTTLVKSWGIRYIKLDFMDDSAVEGYRYQANATALEAQRIGLDLIRKTVGEDVLLDKDGSTMLNPVGYVDYGRTGQDTGHTFTATKEAAPAIAARYYMNRNFFVADPDAFTVSTQTIPDHAWNGGKVALTLDEAKVSIAVSAIAGGMFEIGDDLPTLGSSQERLALVENADLIGMVKLGRPSIPIDLMTFAAEDEQPSIFYLKEDQRQSILTVFNWTEKPRTHVIALSSLGLDSNAAYTVSGILGASDASHLADGKLSFEQPAHSVRMFKLIEAGGLSKSTLPIDHPTRVHAGVSAVFAVHDDQTPPSQCTWSFGDGVTARGLSLSHAYTHAGTYTVHVQVIGLDGMQHEDKFEVIVDGNIPSVFLPSAKTRFTEKR